MNDKIDFEEDLKTGDVERVTTKAREMYLLEKNIKLSEQEVTKKKQKLYKISTEELPAIMAEELSADELPFDNGYRLVIKPIVAGSIPSTTSIKKCKDSEKQEQLINRRMEAMDWLKENGADSIISNVITVVIPKSEDGSQKGAEIIELARDLGLEVSKDQSVHAATLNSYLKEQITSEDGKDIPADVFDLFIGSKAEIKEPKK